MKVNFVISEDKSSRIFSDIFRRYLDSGKLDLTISATPEPGTDIYHYHRPQMETVLMPNSVVTVHHDLDDPDPFVAFERFSSRYKEATAIVCLNTLQQQILSQKGMQHTVVIPHGYDSLLFQKRPHRPVQSRRKMVLGIISKRYPRRFKGEAYLYQLLDYLPTDLFAFLLVGEGRAEDACYLRNLGYEVECHESVPYRVFPSVYSKMDALLMVSTFEGGPANLPEAVASGTPAICTRIGMVPDLIQDGRNGIILSERMEDDAERLCALARNQDGRLDALFVGAGELNTAPTWDEVIDRHVSLYRNIMAKQGIAA